MPCGKEVYTFLADHPGTAAVGLGNVDLRPLPLCCRCGGSGGSFVPEHAEHCCAAAGHQRGDSAVRPEQGFDCFVVLCAAALFQRIPGGSTYGVQVSGTDGFFLRLTVRVGAAAHGIVGGKGLRGGHAVVRHYHREQAVRHRWCP